MSCGHKNLNILKSVKRQLDIHEDQLWSEFQQNPTLFTGVIAQNPLKLDPIGSQSKKKIVVSER